MTAALVYAFAAIGAVVAGQYACRGLDALYRHTLDKLSSAKRWHEAYRSAVADLANETNEHRVTRRALDQAHADIRGMRQRLGELQPRPPRVERTVEKFHKDLSERDPSEDLAAFREPMSDEEQAAYKQAVAAEDEPYQQLRKSYEATS